MCQPLNLSKHLQRFDNHAKKIENTSMEFTYNIPTKDNGREIMRILNTEFKMSRQMIKRLKFNGRVELNGSHVTVRQRVNEGDILYIALEETCGQINHPDGIDFYCENDWYLVCNKPAGIVTHPTHGHLDDSLLTLLSDGTLHPVIRLDRETSGLILIAKNGYAHNTLSEFGDLHKKYLAACYGHFDNTSGTIDKPIARRPGSVMIRDVDPDGKRSVTHYRVIHYDDINNISLVEFTLETGRCHQIRVHSRYLGHPLVGDGLYGPNSIDNPSEAFPNAVILDRKAGRCCLHAYHLSFNDPFDNNKIDISSPLPGDIKDLFCNTELVDEVLGQIY